MRDLNRALDTIQPSFIRVFTEKKRPSALNLGLGQPSLRVDGDLLEEGLRKFRTGPQGYTMNAGLLDLRRAICAHRPEVRPAPDRMLITVGSLEAMYISLGAVVNPGDEVIIVDPAFSIYASATKFFGGVPVSVPMDAERGFPIEADRVRAAITPRTTAICVVSPGNPTGRALDEKEARALAALADEHDLTIIVDEVYRELHHTPAPPRSPAEFSSRVVSVGGLSKSCSMTGLRIGWAIFPAEVYPAALKVHQLCVTCASSLSQYIALAAFEKQALFRHRPIYTERLEHVLAAVEEHLGQRPPRPEGAFYLLVDVRRAGVSSLALAEELRDHEDVVLIPGEAFGESAHGFLRISFAESTETVVEGIRRMGAMVRRKGLVLR